MQGEANRRSPVVPQSAGSPCPTCGSAAAAGETAGSQPSAAPAFVYALGKVEARFPSLGVEKEFMQATARADTEGQTDGQAFETVLAQKENRYLVRQLCWVLTVEGLETYILVPRDPGGLDMLVEAVRPAPKPADVDIVIGVRGPMAPPELCNGLLLPVVLFDQIYSFDADSLIKAIPRPEQLLPEQFEPAAEELFYRIMQMADNAGATDDHRALNYLAVRYPAIYATAAEAFGRNASLTAVEVLPSRLSGARKIVEVVFSFTHRATDVTEKFFTR